MCATRFISGVSVCTLGMCVVIGFWNEKRFQCKSVVYQHFLKLHKTKQNDEYLKTICFSLVIDKTVVLLVDLSTDTVIKDYCSVSDN